MRVLGLVPARGGSKGIARKNIRLLAGKPLVAYTAKSALASLRLARVVLTTEDREIAKIGQCCGLEVPFLRPSDLASDETPMIAVVRHALGASRLGRRVRRSVPAAAHQSLSAPGRHRRRHRVARDHRRRLGHFVCRRRRETSGSHEIHYGGRTRHRSTFCGSIRRPETPGVAEDLSPRGLDLRNQDGGSPGGRVVQRPGLSRWIVPEERACNIDTPFDLFIAEQIISGVGV